MAAYAHADIPSQLLPRLGGLLAEFEKDSKQSLVDVFDVSSSPVNGYYIACFSSSLQELAGRMATWRVPKPPGNHVTPWWLKARGSISPQTNPCILCRRLRLQTDFFGRRQIRRQGELSPSERQRTRGCMPSRTCGRRLRPRRCSAWGRCCVASSATSSRLCRKQLTFVFISSCKKDAYRGGPLQALFLQINMLSCPCRHWGLRRLARCLCRAQYHRRQHRSHLWSSSPSGILMATTTGLTISSSTEARP